MYKHPIFKLGGTYMIENSAKISKTSTESLTEINNILKDIKDSAKIVEDSIGVSMNSSNKQEKDLIQILESVEELNRSAEALTEMARKL
jgi:methyl-accepting chemotaxis protein